MGLGRAFFLGDLGNWLDTRDNEKGIQKLRAGLRAQRNRDRKQDERIQALEEENDELKLYLGSLVRLLVQKGVLSSKELEGLVDSIEGGSAPSD